MLTLRERESLRRMAQAFFDGLDWAARGDLGTELVLYGKPDWMDWGLDGPPPRGFWSEVWCLIQRWEEMRR